MSDTIEPIAIQEASLANDKAAISAIMDQVPEPGEELQGTTATNTPAPEPAKPELPVVTKQEPVVNPDSDEELEKRLDEFKPQTPNQESGFKALKEVVKAERQSKKDLEQKVKELLKAQESIKILTPEMEDELAAAKLQRAAVDPTTDKDFQEKYITPVKSNDERVITILKAGGLRDEVVDSINKAGGFTAAMRSKDKVPAPLGDGTQTWSDWMEEELLPKASLIDRKRIENIMSQSLDLTDKMQQEADHMKSHAKEITEARAQEAGKMFQEGAEEAIKGLGPIANKWEYPKEATPEQKAIVDKHNARQQTIVEQFSQISQDVGNPRKAGTLAVLASASIYLTEVNKDLVTEVDRLNALLKEQEGRIEKIKGSASSARQGNAPAPAAQQENKFLSAKQAVSKMMDEIK